jgi:uncharacterized protein (TIGR00251 family)
VRAQSRLTLRVSPGASRSRVVGRYGDGWKVRVAAPATDGRANDALIKLLASTFDVPTSGVEIVSGHTSRDKTVSLAGVVADEVERRLAAVSADPQGE